MLKNAVADEDSDASSDASDSDNESRRKPLQPGLSAQYSEIGSTYSQTPAEVDEK
jgi:hypothetical protein